MDPLLLLKALILGVVEGLTEFLPVSSTGHLILFGDLLDFTGERAKVFTISIQLGAILAVCWEYRSKIVEVVRGIGTSPSANRFVLNIMIAFLPAAILGLLFIKTIKFYLFHPIPVATALIVGGVLILWAERRKHVIEVEQVDDMDWKHALKVGCAQCLALIPGTSRSGATIIGGLLFGLSRKAAAEFSFFLAIPTMFAATFYDLFKNRELLDANDLGLIAAGFVAAFFSALLAVRGLLKFVSNHDFTIFAWYRIVFGLVILVTAYTGVIGWSEM
ncbi:undecaprenyl-diphosphate phosphatase [Nitrosomonas sp. sh817]|jgi:undecaprenyl-diphosphatase|uniref:undecaprenyl-diphosphate phosphatase n=1 Tax=unclassified Nitrosomonas TaxID=2609265 RepID=UPI0027DADAAA|nr:undecaprenyl-diphosphate phosphatase [Nitrosomonas sp. sh817]WMJ08616.1 undecaprenyl-diphosphate phosphatase [Nitrosomonas sp. sh817]